MTNRIIPNPRDGAIAAAKRNQRRNARQKAARTPFLSDRPGMWTMKVADLNTRRLMRDTMRQAMRGAK